MADCTASSLWLDTSFSVYVFLHTASLAPFECKIFGAGTDLVLQVCALPGTAGP